MRFCLRCVCYKYVLYNCIQNVKMIVSKYSSGVQYTPNFRNAEKRRLISNSQWNILVHSLNSVTKNGQVQFFKFYFCLCKVNCNTAFSKWYFLHARGWSISNPASLFLRANILADPTSEPNSPQPNHVII